MQPHIIAKALQCICGGEILELSKKTGLTITCIYKIRNGITSNPTWRTVDAISKHLPDIIKGRMNRCESMLKELEESVRGG